MKCSVCGEKAIGYTHVWPDNIQHVIVDSTLHHTIKTVYFCSAHEKEICGFHKLSKNSQE